MGTFERSFEVDGERFELYAQSHDGELRYELVDEKNRRIGDVFRQPPDENVVADLVRAVKALGRPTA